MTRFLLSLGPAFFYKLLFVIALCIPSAVFPAQPYLEDTNTISPPISNPNSPDIAGHEWPRLMMAEVQSMTGDIERYSKYDVIATQGALINRIAELQALHPDLMYFRMFNPHEYLSYAGQDGGVSCSQSHGNPFESTTPTTGNCGVYAGHWLYQPGTPTRSAVSANATTIPVEDASRFQVGQYVVIYNAPAGSFNNAEHMRIIAKSNSDQTLTVQRGYKSNETAHDSGSIVAQHSMGNGKTNDPRNWVYNLASNAPRDASSRRYIDFLPIWMSQNYKNDREGNTANVTVSGFLFDTDFHFEYKSKVADANNDLIVDHGISPDGTNWWGEGFELFYAKVRSRFPNLYIVGGFRNVRGFSSINGVQMEGMPVYDDFPNPNPDYSKLNTLLSMYSFQMRNRDVGAPHTHILSKVPTKLYSYGVSPTPSSNAPFRFSLGLALLEDGYFGLQNSSLHPDVWFDEYAVDVTPGSSNYGNAIASTPSDESQVRAHKGWLGKPTGLRQRLYDDTQFSPGQSHLQGGDFESGVGDWTGKELTVSSETSSANVRDGAASLRLNTPGTYQKDFYQAHARSPQVSLSANTQYTLVFSAKASRLREIEVSIGGHSERYMVGPDWQRLVVAFKTNTSSNDYIRFNVGRESTQVWLDSVHLFTGNPNVFRRDFDNGIAVVNATPNSKTINLGEPFKRIKGNQDSVNSGATVSSVTIPPYDSAILVRLDGGNTNDTQKPAVIIDAPTKSSVSTITDTTIQVSDDQAILSSDVVIRSDNTAGISNFNCTQTSVTQVDCSIEITSSGDLKITATDEAGNGQDADEDGYQITTQGPDLENPGIIITAPTKTSDSTITDTTIAVSDNQALLASEVGIRSDNTAGAQNLICTQTNVKRVDCTIEITSSGDLKLNARDLAGRTTNKNENGYLITPPNPDTEKPQITINAPTKVSNATIVDTTIVVTDNEAIMASAVELGASNTAGTSNLNCTQTSVVQVDCTIDVTTSGDLHISATDEAGNAENIEEAGYQITPPNLDTEKPQITINAPTKVSNGTIVDTTIVVTDNEAIVASAVGLGAGNTAGTSNLNCTQTSVIQVNCIIDITTSGDLQISATDEAGNGENVEETGYQITPPNPDNEKPQITINAPTKTSTGTIVDTTIVVTDNEAIVASAVGLGAGNTAGIENLNCIQTSVDQVDCTIDVTTSGDLQISATDVADNTQEIVETDYLITPPDPDIENPGIIVTAPTKTSDTTISDTTIKITDNRAILVADVGIRSDNTAGVANFACVQTSPIRVDCTIDITSSGDLKLIATDQAGRMTNKVERGYVITTTNPDTEKPVITINAPTKTSGGTISDTTIVVTDDREILASEVIVRSDNTAGVSNLICSQTSRSRVDCSIDITRSGDLKLNATDVAGNSDDADENGYTIDLPPDFNNPEIEVIAPTKFSTTIITDTTIVVVDDQAILASKVTLRSSNSAGVSNFNCTQTSTTRVDCSLDITSTGDLKLVAKDEGGNATVSNENGYLISSTAADKTKPSLQIIAPTKVSDDAITNTKIIVKDNLAVLANSIFIRQGSTAQVRNFNCVQINVARVDCTLHIVRSGDIKLSAVDAAGNVRFKSEDGYVINNPPPSGLAAMPAIHMLLFSEDK